LWDRAEVDRAPPARGGRRTATARSPDDHRAVAAVLKARIETLEAELAKLEAAAAVHRADFRGECRDSLPDTAIAFSTDMPGRSS
jgi:hypothetical protein